MLPFFSWFYEHYFRVSTEGWQHIPPSGKGIAGGCPQWRLSGPRHRYDDLRLVTHLWSPTASLCPDGFPHVAGVSGGSPPGRLGRGGAGRANDGGFKVLREDAALLIYPGGIRDVFRPHRLRDKICFFGQKKLYQAGPAGRSPNCASDFPWGSRYIAHSGGSLSAPGAAPSPGHALVVGSRPRYLSHLSRVALGVGDWAPLPNIPLPLPLHTAGVSPHLVLIAMVQKPPMIQTM